MKRTQWNIILGGWILFVQKFKLSLIHFLRFGDAAGARAKTLRSAGNALERKSSTKGKNRTWRLGPCLQFAESVLTPSGECMVNSAAHGWGDSSALGTHELSSPMATMRKFGTLENQHQPYWYWQPAIAFGHICSRYFLCRAERETFERIAEKKRVNLGRRVDRGLQWLLFVKLERDPLSRSAGTKRTTRRVEKVFGSKLFFTGINQPNWWWENADDEGFHTRNGQSEGIRPGCLNHRGQSYCRSGLSRNYELVKLNYFFECWNHGLKW